ncbi:uracil-DNA glycosylase family protein, partial [Shewanella sp. SM103]
NMVEKEQLPIFAENTLKHILDDIGEVVYSSHETLRKGDVYLLGLNPGGSGQTNPDTGVPYTIRSHLQRMLKRNENSFYDESWENGQSKYPKCGAPLQKRVIELLKGIDIDDPRTVCASNIIFKTSRSAADLCFGLAGLCWPVHEAILKIIQPSLILTYGIDKISAYAFLKALFLKGDEVPPQPSLHGQWNCRGFHCDINGVHTFVAAVPHLSYYSPANKQDVFNWIIANQKKAKARQNSV